jgi:hypothetical protein
MHAVQVQTPRQTWQPVEVEVEVLGNNSYRLSWQVPENCYGYRLKFSDKPIVNWLGYNKYDQSYKFDPDKYTARYAAAVYDNVPSPLKAGSRQTLTIADMSKVIADYNSRRGRQADQIGYLPLNETGRYYFDLRYLRAE